MEVLKTDDNLKEEILSDAKKKAERIIIKAKNDIEELEKNTRAEIEQYEKDTKKTVEKNIEIETNKIFASVDIEVKKKSLNLTGRMIDSVFDELSKDISTSKLFEYKQFTLKLIQNASNQIKSSSYILEINKNELARLSKDSLKSLKLNGGEIKEIIEKNITGLMLLSGDRKKGAYISLDDFIDRFKEDERIRVYDILLKGEIL
jgi:vacuolar-type H+-ATPase subunit E/Vma4